MLSSRSKRRFSPWPAAEVPSSVIGNLVLDHLAQMDQVAHIRFASVYLNINDLNDLRAEIDRLMGR